MVESTYLTTRWVALYTMSENLRNAQRLILRIGAVIGFLFFSIELAYYFFKDYIPFVSRHLGFDIYFASALRLVCALGYPVAMAGIYYFRQWAAVLLVSVWVLQLLPSAILSLAARGGLTDGHYVSLGELFVSAALLYWCRHMLVGKTARPIMFFLIIALLAHTALYAVFNVDRLI